MDLRWAFLLVLASLLAAWGQKEPGPEVPEEAKKTATCKRDSLPETASFSTDREEFQVNETVLVTCPGDSKDELFNATCTEVEDNRADWNFSCLRRCKAPSDWDPKLQFTPNKTSYALNELVQLSCAGGYEPSVPVLRCISNRSQSLWNGTATCEGKCPKPQWDQHLQFSPTKSHYEPNEELTLTCPEDLEPSFSQVKCAREFVQQSSGKPVYRDAWWGRNSTGGWIRTGKTVLCTRTCQRPQWDQRLQLAPDHTNYKKNEKIRLSCPRGLHPSFSQVKCSGDVQSMSYSGSVNQDVWLGKIGTSNWTHIQRAVECIKKCRKPQWDPRLLFSPNKLFYEYDEVMVLSCPEGHGPPPMEITCVKLNPSWEYPDPQDAWHMRNGMGTLHRIEGNMTCVELLQVVPGTLEVSATSIKLNWTCRFPDACQHMRAMCRLAGPSSPPCEAEEVTGEEMLQGQKGTFTCPPLQPFTVYNVTISLPPSTVPFTWQFRTEETVPDKVENLSLDRSTGSLRWNALPSCKGEILGYQLSITARSAHEGGFLEIERLRVNGSVTEHALPDHRPEHTYVVMVQGLTAAGAGDVSRQEFLSSDWGTAAPLNVSSCGARDISPSQGTAVLPLRPIAQPHAAVREHQLVVAVTQDTAAEAGVCSEELQPFDASLQHRAYVAAVLNLTAPTDFVLGDGTHQHGYYNAPLQPDRNYTVLLRLVRRQQQAEKFTCVCYSFSVGQAPAPWPWTAVIVVAVLLVLAFLSAGILWFVLSRRKKALISQTKGNN